ncbi:probable pectinesterase/pectinesterase inhibitor 21 [Diospyros lotus]|uniref:probable pectinesterase/pectinesterase inhibitor 21 n=1 Tax=Diospyros lotus TaxID=55363 RepID=UPI00224D8190|nr:probable pectinesterase/pectinesterase inhibitor 21 [Diospyros lotus]
MANKVAVMGVSSVLLVAMVVAVTIGVSRKNGGDPGGVSGGGGGGAEISASKKAVHQICQPTDYKETCEKTLSGGGENTTDPKKLIKVGFDAAVKELGEVIKNSSFFQEGAKDPRTKDALENCGELLQLSIDDLKRSFDEVESFDVTKMNEYVDDLKTWLTAAGTYQETCIDGFENTTGDFGEKMRKLLKLSSELTSNGLAIVTELSGILTSYPLSSSNSRRLLSEDGLPEWTSAGQRRLLQASPGTLKPNVVVAQDGSGKYKTINEALKEVPIKGDSTFVIYIKAGLYKEIVNITKQMKHVVLIGDGPTKTKISGNRSFKSGYNTFKTATLTTDGEFVMLKNLYVENTAGHEGHQAVALRVGSDRAIVYNCHLDGFQDTLYVHTHRQFYRDCTITGTVDFIFGDSATIFQNCKMIVKKPGPNQDCMVTAQGRKEERAISALVLQNCTITAEPAFVAAKGEHKAYLGRPWKTYSRTVIMDSFIDGSIDPAGWAPWQGDLYLDTIWYAEYNNRGPGSDTSKRVTWKGIKKITAESAQSFTAGRFIDGDTWVKPTGVTYKAGMK